MIDLDTKSKRPLLWLLARLESFFAWLTFLCIRAQDKLGGSQ